MNNVYNELTELFTKIDKALSIKDIDEIASLDKLKEICDSSNEMSSIFEMDSMSYSMVYSNKAAFEYLGITEDTIQKMGFKYIISIIHPDNISSMYNMIKFYANKENKNLCYTGVFFIKVKNGWEWTYSCMKPAIYNADGTVKYLLSTGCSIDNLLKSHKNYKNLQNNLSFFEAHAAKYLSLTSREKEVLHLIAEEHTSKEIAGTLHISPYTVDTYRKTLIEKLQVKSSIGLARYGVLFSLK